MDQWSGDGRFIGRIKFLAIKCWKDFPNFEMLDARIASALYKIIPNSHFKKKGSLEEQKAQKEDQFLRGRQIAFMIYDYFRLTGTHDTVLDYADSFSVTLSTIMFGIRFKMRRSFIFSMSKIPVHDVLESLYKLRIRESAQLKKTVLELYDMEIRQKMSIPKYQKLKTMVKRNIDQKLRLRNFDAGHGKIETDSVVNNRKGLSGVERGRGVCYRSKETSAVCGMRVMIVHQNRHRKPLHPLCHQWHEVEARREKEASEAEVTCTRSPCECWYPPECRLYETESGCKAGDKCLFSHYKIEEQPSKKRTRAITPKRKSDDKGAVAMMKTVPQLCCVSQDSEPSELPKSVKYRGKPEA